MAKGIANRKDTGEFKQIVVETMLKEKFSYREAAKHFGINIHERIRQWERIYLEEGSKGLYIERRGRASLAKDIRGLSTEN